jgi:superfamily II DNA/RNA helicase
VQIEHILQFIAPKRQTLLFSATMPQNIVRIAEKYLNDPARIAVSSVSAPAANIQQENIYVSEGEKYSSLVTHLNKREGSVLIFIKTKSGADRMTTKLINEGHDAQAIHGGLSQSKRERVLNEFRVKKYRILVATDVASRGLDVPHIKHVINYDLPQCPEDYVHRIGRTARAGAAGFSLTLITPSDKGKWKAIDRILNPGRFADNAKSEKEDKRVSHDRKKTNDSGVFFKKTSFQSDLGRKPRQSRRPGSSRKA